METKIEGVHQVKLTLLHSRASALCSSFCLKQLLHLLLLNMFGANFLHSAPVPRTPPLPPLAVPPDISRHVRINRAVDRNWGTASPAFLPSTPFLAFFTAADPPPWTPRFLFRCPSRTPVPFLAANANRREPLFPGSVYSRLCFYASRKCHFHAQGHSRARARARANPSDEAMKRRSALAASSR